MSEDNKVQIIIVLIFALAICFLFYTGFSFNYKGIVVKATSTTWQERYDEECGK